MPIPISAKNVFVTSLDGISKLWKNPENQYYTREFYSDTEPDLIQSLPLHLDFAHEEHCYKNYYRKREFSEVFSIELVLDGSMYFKQRECEYRVMAGEVFLVLPDQNMEFATGPENHCHRLACCFSGHALGCLLDSTGLIEQDIVRLGNFVKLETLMRKCIGELRDKSEGFRQRASVTGYEIMLELANSIEHSDKSALLTRAVNLLEHHLSQKISLQKLASATGSNPASLHRAFHEKFGISPINYFIKLKMEAAKSLLLNTSLPIQTIAERTGYSNQLYFSAEFRKRIGLCPREFRKRNGIIRSNV
jgi:AraC-like DNA-binding protein